MWVVIAVPLAVLLFPLALLRVERALLPRPRVERGRIGTRSDYVLA